ncbi:MAG: Fe-S protein assembly co-chaperone HscB [Methylophilaceae bacterium]|jgi:molecular chaperone HscB
MMSVLQQNFFELFGLPAQYSIDSQALAQAYQQLQRQYHPDRYVNAEPQQQRESLQIATYANEAYQTLKQDTARARYLLQLQGIDTMDESNTAMPADFLMLQMEWREALEDAKHARDLSALLDLSADIQQQAKQIKQDLQQSCEQQVWSQAASLVRELSFIDKILSDIQHTAEQF